jgi:hypothetical protein
MEVIQAAIRESPRPRTRDGSMPFDAYTLYYVGQALYQVHGDYWQESYPRLRDYLVDAQVSDQNNPQSHGAWRDHGARLRARAHHAPEIAGSGGQRQRHASERICVGESGPAGQAVVASRRRREARAKGLHV